MSSYFSIRHCHLQNSKTKKTRAIFLGLSQCFNRGKMHLKTSKKFYIYKGNRNLIKIRLKINVIRRQLEERFEDGLQMT